MFGKPLVPRRACSGRSKPTVVKRLPISHGPDLGIDLSPWPQLHYNKYFKKRLNQETPHGLTAKWLALPSLSKARDGLPARLQAEPLQILDDRGAEFELVIKCLESQVADFHLTCPTREDARTRFMETNIGKKALRWLLDSKAYTKTDIFQHASFSKLLVHALVAEKDDEWVWRVMHSKEGIALDGLHRPHVWKSVLLRHLMWSHMWWSTEPEAFHAGS